MSNERYVQIHYNHILNQAKKLAPNLDIAQEWTQISILSLLSQNRYSGDPNCLKSRNNYMWGIILNIWREWNKAKKKSYNNIEIDSDLINVEIKESSIERDPLRTLYEDELRHEGYTDDQILKLSRINSYVRKLSPPDRNLYKLYFIEGLSYREISKKIGIPTASIYELMRSLKMKLYNASKNEQKPLY